MQINSTRFYIININNSSDNNTRFQAPVCQDQVHFGEKDPKQLKPIKNELKKAVSYNFIMCPVLRYNSIRNMKILANLIDKEPNKTKTWEINKDRALNVLNANKKTLMPEDYPAAAVRAIYELLVPPEKKELGKDIKETERITATRFSDLGQEILRIDLPQTFAEMKCAYKHPDKSTLVFDGEKSVVRHENLHENRIILDMNAETGRLMNIRLLGEDKKAVNLYPNYEDFDKLLSRLNSFTWQIALIDERIKAVSDMVDQTKTGELTIPLENKVPKTLKKGSIAKIKKNDNILTFDFVSSKMPNNRTIATVSPEDLATNNIKFKDIYLLDKDNRQIPVEEDDKKKDLFYTIINIVNYASVHKAELKF